MSKFDSARIPTFSPGIEWYATQVRSGTPLSLVRYGEGDLRTAVPPLPLKAKKGAYGFWYDHPEAVEDFTLSLLNTPNHLDYFPAIWHQGNIIKWHWMPKLKRWLRDNNLDWIKWHRGRVWRLAMDKDKLYVFINAMKEQPLPIVMVGPERIRPAADRMNAELLVTHPTEAYFQKDGIKNLLLSLPPSFITFSAGGTAKMLISELFPLIGHQSFLIDFGAYWDYLCGNKIRKQQKLLPPERLARNWGEQ